MRIYFIIMIALLTNSCVFTGNILTDKNINKQETFESNELNITTTIEKYSKSKEWFYGKIEIENKTEKNIQFNFDQNLKIGDEILKADYNFKPVSYAHIAFRIAPKSLSTWDVVWRMKDYSTDMEIIILDDLTVKEFKE